MKYEYGFLQDIQRLKTLITSGGGQTNCKLNKMPDGKLTDMGNACVCDINHPLGSTVTARYYKGIGAHKDNMVIEIWELKDANA